MAIKLRDTCWKADMTGDYVCFQHTESNDIKRLTREAEQSGLKMFRSKNGTLYVKIHWRWVQVV